MIKIIILLFISIPTILFGQATKKIIDKEIYEVYYVLKSSKSIKHGKFNKYFNEKLDDNRFNNISVEGQYKNGTKDSIWKYYDYSGKVSLEYDYTASKVIFYNSNLKFKIFKVINIDNSSDTILTRPPIHLDGELNFFRIIRYPTNAMNNGISGKVSVTFTIDTLGISSNHHVKNPLGFGLDEEAIRVIKMIPDNWLPGLVNEKKVNVQVTYSIFFKLPE